MSKVSGTSSKPSRILCRANLLVAWKSSRDSKAQAGTKGIDGISARTFSANLDLNIQRVVREIAQGEFHFSSLRPFPIAKANSDKRRLICIPTVRDRLVQRRISFHLYHSKLLPIYYEGMSFGFVPEQGVKRAIDRVIEYRQQYDFCFETDVVSFFDRINRIKLKAKIDSALKRSSLRNIVMQAVDIEVKPNRDCNTHELKKLGIHRGLGIRQGMPLSPILSNLALSDFDKAMKRHRVPVVRYADDIVAFAKTRSDAEAIAGLIKAELEALDQSIPDFGIDSKTGIVGKSQPLSFLGREIVYLESRGRFVQRVSKSKIDKIKENIRERCSVDRLVVENKNLLDGGRQLSQIISSCINSYKDADNAIHVKYELQAAMKENIKSMYVQIFGEFAVSKASKKYASFLGMETADIGVYEYYDL